MGPSCPSLPESLQVTPSMSHSTFPYPYRNVLPCSGLMAVNPQLPLRGLCCHPLSGAALGPGAPPRWEPAHPHVRGEGTATGSLLLSLTLPVSLSSPTPRVSTFPLSPWLKPASPDDTSRPSALTLSPESACVSPSGLYLSTCQRGGEEPVPGAGAQGTHAAARTWFVEKAPELVLHVSLTLLQVLLLEAKGWE